jgi:hypothetical protein
MIVTAFNPETDELEKTYVSSYLASGNNSLPVKNNDRFVAGRRILLGRMGDERSELATADTINSNKIQIGLSANTKFAHNQDDPVYLLDYDQVNFYRKDDIDATPVLMFTTDIDVDNAENVTRWDDTTSLTSHYYTTTFSNSVTGDETDFADPVKAGGYEPTTAGNIIDQVVRRVRDTSYNVLTIDEYLDIMNEVGSDLITQAHRPYRFLKRTALLDTVPGQNYIELPTDLWKFNHVFVVTLSGNYQRYDEVDPLSEEQFNNRYDNNQSSNQDNILDVAIDEENHRLLIHPAPLTAQTGVVKLSYYKTFTNIDDLGSIIETPNNLIYRYKLMAEFYSAKSETDQGWARLAQKYEEKYGNEIVKMQRVNRLDTGTPRSMMPRRAYRRRRYELR